MPVSVHMLENSSWLQFKKMTITGLISSLGGNKPDHDVLTFPSSVENVTYF
jgi:hypothetical protein